MSDHSYPSMPRAGPTKAVPFLVQEMAQRDLSGFGISFSAFKILFLRNSPQLSHPISFCTLFSSLLPLISSGEDNLPFLL